MEQPHTHLPADTIIYSFIDHQGRETRVRVPKWKYQRINEIADSCQCAFLRGISLAGGIAFGLKWMRRCNALQMAHVSIQQKLVGGTILFLLAVASPSIISGVVWITVRTVRRMTESAIAYCAGAADENVD